MYSVSLKTGPILATAASIHSACKANQFFCTVDVDGNSWWCFWLLCTRGALFLPGSGNHKGNTTDIIPVTNKLPEMEISGCLCSQIEEHDEVKKNSLTLFCLFRLCSTSWNTNPSNYSHHIYLIFFLLSSIKGELSNHEEKLRSRSH